MRTNMRNFQEVRLQENRARHQGHSLLRTIWVSLEDDLVESCKPGDDLEVWLAFLLHIPFFLFHIHIYYLSLSFTFIS